MKRKQILLIIGIVVLGIVVYYGINFYEFGTGVIKDFERMKNFEYPDSVKVNDSTTYIIKEVK